MSRLDPQFATSPEVRYQYLLSLYQRAKAVVGQLDLTGYASSAALASESALNRAVSDKAPYWAVASLNAPLASALGLKLEGATYRDWVVLQFQKAEAGVPYLHPDNLRRVLADGRISQAWVDGDWERRCRTFQAIIYADEQHMLDAIKTKHLALGVAVPVVAVVVAVIVIVAVICAIAWVISESAKTTQMNAHYQQVIGTVCYDAAGNWRSSPECLAAVKAAADPALSKTAAQQLMEKLLVYGALGVGAYVVVQIIINRASRSDQRVVIQTGGAS